MDEQIVPVVRSVDLIQIGEKDYVWRYADGAKEELGPHFKNPDSAKAWMFTPVWVNGVEEEESLESGEMAGGLGRGG